MRVTAFAKGLFSLVESQELGRGLSELSDTMAATVDVTSLLGLSKLKEDFIVALTGSNLQPIFAFSVPADKVWHVRAYGGRLATGAGVTVATAYLAVKLANLSGPGTFMVAIGEGLSLAASSSGTLTMKGNDLWLPPGASLGYYGSFAGGVPAADLGVLYEEFDA